MSISIITRSYRLSELKGLASYLEGNKEIEKEVIAVCNIKDTDLRGIKLILQNSNRFEARITGIKNAKYDKVLLLDSDQIPENDLLLELDNRDDDMVIIPEKSISESLTAKCLDDWRTRNENLARKRISPYILVVPRFYRKIILLEAIGKMPHILFKTVSHEDSILYYESFRITQNVGFSVKHIYNDDPGFFTLMQKAFLYGKFMKSTRQMDLPNDILYLLDKLNKSSANVKDLGFGSGYFIQIPRAFAYELGRLL